MIKAHRMMAYARAQGAPWDVIEQQLAQGQQQYLGNGGDFWDMTGKMGFGDPQIMRDRLTIEQKIAKAQNDGR
jgi:hypothetical protein